MGVYIVIAGMAKPAMTARAKVDGIRKRLGFPSKEYLDKFNQDGLQELLQEMLEMLQSKDRIIGGSIITLVLSLEFDILSMLTKGN